MIAIKNPEQDLRLQHKSVLELAIVVSLILHIAAFRLLPDFDVDFALSQSEDLTIQVADIPQTEQFQRPVRPALPSIPVPVEDESIPEDLTIESTEINLDLASVPPPPAQDDAEEHYTFIPYDEPPALIGGIAMVQKNLRYPEIARKAGLEGTVVVAILVGTDGRTLKTEILKDSGTDLGFEQAAQSAFANLKWRPAKQRDRAVKVWVSFPVRFRLANTEKVRS